ncbi:MAG: alpha/beta hydrolase [Chloroflexaceae bacterium]|nr:alpha/beta hydrolase [Chloroflexaceae bacterium]
MSAIYLDNRLVHYEVYGRGQPIIFLHSWVGSWRYWVPMMDLVTERYRAYALDFWGFGDSDRSNGTNIYTIGAYAEMLVQFTNQMGVSRANLIGHGLGGMVAVHAARTHPDRFPRLMLVSTPLRGQIIGETSRPNALSRLMGRSSPADTWSKLIRQMPIDNATIKQEVVDDTEGLSENVVKAVQQSVAQTDLLPMMNGLTNTPLLAVYGEKDSIVPPEHANVLNNESDRPHQLLVLPRLNHFPFLEDTATFGRLIMDFIVSQGSPVEIKEQWRRRVSQREYI